MGLNIMAHLRRAAGLGQRGEGALRAGARGAGARPKAGQPAPVERRASNHAAPRRLSTGFSTGFCTGLYARLSQGLSTDCPLCGLAARAGRFCPGCAADLRAHYTASARCPRCARPLAGPPGWCGVCIRRPPAFACVVAAVDYAPPADAGVRRYKDGRLADGRALAALMAQAWREAGLAEAGALLTSVPASRRGLRQRGFCPPAELARRLARELGLPFAPWALRRLREVPRQHGQGARGRRRALRGVFAADPAQCAGRPVILVDDVLTTGATAQACALALRRAGAGPVTVLVAARTPARSAALAQ